MLQLLSSILFASTVYAIPADLHARNNTAGGRMPLVPAINITAVVAAQYTSIVVFGDGWSDIGNGACKWTNGTYPPEFYDHGRLSNGLIWSEIVSHKTGLPLHSYAIGSATTSNELCQGYTLGSPVPVPGVLEQVKGFIKNPPADVDYSTALFVIHGGSPDGLFNNKTAEQSVASLERSFAVLKNAGARNFLTWTVPDLAAIPIDEYLPAERKPVLRLFSIMYWWLHGAMAKKYNAAWFDMRSLIKTWFYYGEPEKYGFDKFGAYGSCVVGVYGEASNITICEDPDKMVFWDRSFPSANTHRQIAQAVLVALYEKIVNETVYPQDE